MAPVNSQLKVYVDKYEYQSTEHTGQDVDGWHKARIRFGVIDRHGIETAEFISWKARCIGRIVIQPEVLDEKGNYTKIPRWYAYLETQEDLVSYVLTFDEPQPLTNDVDIAAFYCPYVPLTFSGATSTDKNEI